MNKQAEKKKKSFKKKGQQFKNKGQMFYSVVNRVDEIPEN